MKESQQRQAHKQRVLGLFGQARLTTKRISRTACMQPGYHHSRYHVIDQPQQASPKQWEDKTTFAPTFKQYTV